jgi:hypothetical protein
MTREQATSRCRQLNREGDGQRHWFVRQAGPDDWQVVSIAAPGQHSSGSLTQTIPSRSPAEPSSPPTIIRNIPPYGPGPV